MPRSLMLAIPLLFVTGVTFGYFVVLPAAVRFFQNFNSGEFNVLVQASQYYHFAAVILLAMGLVFQVPVAILAATRAGVVTPRSCATTGATRSSPAARSRRSCPATRSRCCWRRCRCTCCSRRACCSRRSSSGAANAVTARWRPFQRDDAERRELRRLPADRPTARSPLCIRCGSPPLRMTA